jgi:flagellar basal-body rod protein FlgB
MIRNLLNIKPLVALKKGVDGTNLRARAIADNLANASTPGYKRKSVQFEEELSRALEGGKKGLGERVSRVKPELQTDYYTNLRMDGNNVDFDKEVVAAAQTTGKNVAMIELMSRFYAQLQTAFRERMR